MAPPPHQSGNGCGCDSKTIDHRLIGFDTPRDTRTCNAATKIRNTKLQQSADSAFSVGVCDSIDSLFI
jgi:hypothetical protein